MFRQRPNSVTRAARTLLPCTATPLALAWLLLAASASAQDFGIINLEVPASRAVALAYPLLSTDSPTGVFPNRVGDVLFALPEGFRLRKLVADDQWQTNLFRQGAWSAPEMTLLPGEAAVFDSPAPTPTRLQFAGIVPTGIVRTYLRAGRSLVATPIPIEGRAFSDLGLPRIDGLGILALRPGNAWELLGRIVDGQWNGSGTEPSFSLGEGFMVDSPRAVFWEVNHPPQPPNAAIEFTSVPVDQVILSGQALTLEARVANPADLSFQWQRNGTNIPGANFPIFHLERAEASDSGDYWLVVFGLDRLQFSPLARVVVQAPPLQLSINRGADPFRLEITLTGVADEEVDVERSSDLRQWETARTRVRLPAKLPLTPSLGPQYYFYRARRR